MRRPRRIRNATHNAPVDPIRNIQRPVGAEGGKVVGGDRLRLAHPLEHEQLWKNRDGLEENGERPQEFGDGEGVVEEECEHDARCGDVLDAERVYRGVVCWTAHDGKEGRGLMVEI